MSARDDLVRELTRTKKRDLVVIARTLADARGHEYVYGGPNHWSKDELISYIVSERQP
jgi:hypothetical protein